jgi:hypothetical protein
VVLLQRSIQRRGPQQIQLGIQWRDPPLKDDSTRAGDSEQVPIPRGLRGGGQGTVRAVIVDELLKVGE